MEEKSAIADISRPWKKPPVRVTGPFVKISVLRTFLLSLITLNMQKAFVLADNCFVSGADSPNITAADKARKTASTLYPLNYQALKIRNECDITLNCCLQILY